LKVITYGNGALTKFPKDSWNSNLSIRPLFG
jgi:hypothetical protein